MSDRQRFCDIMRKRSTENRLAVQILYSNGLIGQVLSVMRQELDSMVRAIYLLTINDLSERNNLIEQTLSGQKWKRNKSQITDRQMVDIADRLNGWTQSVYKFGCGFIHLSVLHDYLTEDPFDKLDATEIEDIKRHLNNYHDFPMTSNLTMVTLKPYLPKVFDKISGNLECYIGHLEEEKIGVD